jgi:hypothetical protein
MEARVEEACKYPVSAFRDELLIAGFDVSGAGYAWKAIRFHRGIDARTAPQPIRLTGQQGRDRSALIAIAAEVLKDQRRDYKVAAMFVDSAVGAPIVERLHTLGFDNVLEVNFGGPSPDPHKANWRSYMWTQMKDWLLKGGIQSMKKAYQTR